MPLTKVTYSMIKSAPANVLDYGADPTGVADSTAAFVAAVAANLEVWVPEGQYKVTAPIQLRPGQHVFGSNGGELNDGSIITNTVVGSGIFQMVQDVTAPYEQLDGVFIENLSLIADYPIRLNDETKAIAEIGPTPFIMKPTIRNCSIDARVAGVGTGVSMSKVFGFLIESCKIQRFDINLMMQGCDIGRVVLNRIAYATSYNLLEISTGTFGSQNHIENNDILVMLDTGGTHIKTCARHVRLYNNYIEQSAASTATGAIDMTNIGCPQYGPNVPGYPYTIVCQDNRVDGHPYFTSFIHYLDGTNPARSVKLYDPGTPGIPAADGVLLKIQGKYLQPVYNVFHNTNYDISIPNTYTYDKFRNTDAVVVTRSGATITPSNLVGNRGFPVNDAGYVCGYNGNDALAIKPTMVPPKSPLNLMLSQISATVRHPLEVGVNYEVYVTARSPASETLNASWGINFTSGGILTPMALTPDYSTTMVGIVTAPALNQLVGAYFTRSTAIDDIFVRSVEFVRV